MHEHDRIYVPYKDARELIQEADLLLYRGKAWHSYCIQRATRSEHSHIGLASWHNGVNKTKATLETIEFHGFRGGGVTFKVSNLFPKYSKLIDVYRPNKTCEHIIYNTISKQIETHLDTFDGKAITNTMRGLTGLPYGWKRIWWFIKSYFFGFRFFYDIENLTSDEIKDIIYPVCSTAIAYSFSKNKFKLIHARADDWTQPGDFAMSPMTNYLFTLV